MAISFPITGVTAAVTASRSPSFTLDTSPVENDILVAFISSSSAAATTDVSGWTNVLGANTEVSLSDSTTAAAMAYHRVTAAEDTANTVTWTLTNFWDATETGRISVAVLRGVATTGELVGTGTDSNIAATTDGTIATVTPTADSVVIAGFCQDGTGTRTSAPTGYTDIAGDSASQHNWIYYRTTNATANNATGTAAANTTTNDEYISIVAAFKQQLPVPSAIACTTTFPAPTISAGTAVSASAISRTVTIPAVSPSLVKSATVTATSIAATTTIRTPIFAPYPVSVSSRKWLDQFGNVFLLKTMSSWGMAQELSDANITIALEDAAARGFNGVTVALFGNNYGAGWDRYTNQAAEAAFTGSPYASSLGAAWGTVDHIVEECTRLGMCPVLSLYTGFGTVGCEADIISAGTTNMRNFGIDVATRYAAYPNIVWHLGADDNWTYGNGPYAEVEAYFDGIKDTEGSTNGTRLVIAEANNGSSTYSQWPSAHTGTGGFSRFRLDANAIYDYTADSVVNVDAIYTESGATTYAVWDSEPPYKGADHYSGTESIEMQNQRERNYSVFLRGGIGINFGHEDWWTFGATGLYTDGIAWTAVMDSLVVVEASYAWTLLDLYVADTTWAPSADGGFLNTGVGSGDTKAAVGLSDTAALVYFPNTRASIEVDTTLLSGTNNVRLRWYDPTAGTYTTIAASEAQSATRSITYPTTNSNSSGADDWVLVVDLTSSSNATVAATSFTATTTFGSRTLSAGTTITTINGTGGITAIAIAATTTIPASTMSAGTTITATSVTSTTALPAPTLSAGATITATSVAATTTFGSPALADGAAVTATSVAASTTFGSRTLAAGSTIAATAITRTTTFGTIAVGVSAAVTATSVAATTTFGTPSLTSGTNIAGSSVAATTSIPVPSVSAGSTRNATATPASVSASTSFGTLALTAAASLNATSVAATSAFGTSTTAASTTITATAVLASTTIPTPTITAGSAVNATVTPNPILVTTTVASPTFAAGTRITATAATATVSVPTPSIFAGVTRNATVTPSSFTATATLAAATVSSSATVTANSVAATTSFGTPALSAGTRIAAVSIRVTSTVGTLYAPGYYVVTIRAESRTLTIPAEDRTAVIHAESRTLEVPDGA